MKYEYLDVELLDELPQPPKNKRYLEFLGGTKNYRCYLVDSNMPRCDFYANNLDCIDEILHPIYNNRGILVAQDNTFPIPGFYIVSFNKKYKNITEVSDSLIIRSSFIIKNIRKGMEDVLGIKYVNIYYEEKNKNSNNVHYWIMPKTDKVDLEKKLHELDLNNYLNSFDYKKNKSKIKKYNDLLREYIEKINLKKLDDELFNKIDLEDKKINLCISNRCFLKCFGCYNNFCYKEQISCANILSFLEFARQKGLKKVTLSGGDPLAREDILEIIQGCLNLNLKVNLDTVGFPLMENSQIIGMNKSIKKFDNLDLFKKISMIGIPLDGSNNEVINKFRIGLGDIIKKQMQVLDIFEKNNIDICVNTVFHKQNKDDILNIYEILKKYNCVKKWQIFQYMPIGPLGKLNEDKYKVSVSEFNCLKEKIDMIRDDSMMIEVKPAIERAHNYMLVNSSGIAYKVDINNNKEIYGDLKDPSTWDEIINNLG